MNLHLVGRSVQTLPFGHQAGQIRSLVSWYWRGSHPLRFMPHSMSPVGQPAHTQAPSVTAMAQAPPASAWDGKGSQQELMYKDECIVVDDNDCITGHASKYDVHSHPLHGYDPGEVDDYSSVASGAVMGTKRAAVRKLGHELGIPPHQLPLDRFKFLTRLHYCAADEETYGPKAEWGEHEIDYILFVKADVDVAPNSEEVDAYEYVNITQLKSMMKPTSGLLWSPWFRILANHFLENWWQDIDKTLQTNDHVDLHKIHKI
ncbi:hypothetical protein WJX79_008998 [Trebouxia sp. C0005]